MLTLKKIHLENVNASFNVNLLKQVVCVMYV